jgi:hypothetical protein
MAMRMLGPAARLAIVGIVIAVGIVSMTNPMGPAGFLSVPYAITGGVVVTRRPQTSIGWLLLGLALSFALIAVPVTGTPGEFTDGTIKLSDALFAVIHSGLPTTNFLLFAVLMLVFPSGRLPGGRWGRPVALAVGTGLVFATAAYFLPEIGGSSSGAWVRNPAALLPTLWIWQVVTPGTVVVPAMLLTLGGAVSMVVRARRATGTERQQLRWIAAAFAVLILAVGSGYILSILVPGTENGLAWIPAVAAFPTVPVAIGIAVLRYRLFEIDRIISRTIGYAVVTAVLAAVFLGINLILQTWVAGATGGSTIAVAVTTLVVAALFQPLRRVTQAPIDRRFNRSRVDADRTLAAFGERVRDEVELTRLSGVVVDAAGEAVHPNWAGLWLRSPSG